MRISGKIAEPEFDSKTFTRDMQKNFRELFYRSMSAFLVEGSKRVPVDTGMARGTFLNLQQYLRGKGINPILLATIFSSPQRLDKKGKPLRYSHVDGRKMTKTPFTAKKLTTKSSKVANAKNPYELVFEYETSVLHFNLNEFLRGWQAFETGREAFMEAAQSLRPIVPEIKSFLAFTVITLGKNAPADIRLDLGNYRVPQTEKD